MALGHIQDSLVVIRRPYQNCYRSHVLNQVKDGTRNIGIEQAARSLTLLGGMVKGICKNDRCLIEQHIQPHWNRRKKRGKVANVKLCCPEIALHKSKTDESKREGDQGQKSKALGTIKRNGKEENFS